MYRFAHVDLAAHTNGFIKYISGPNETHDMHGAQFLASATGLVF